MNSRNCRPSLVGTIDGGRLEFDVIRLPGQKTLGVVRRLKLTGVGLYEMTVLFDSHDAFEDWLSADEYRHHAPGLMAFVKSRFDALHDIAASSHEQEPCLDHG